MAEPIDLVALVSPSGKGEQHCAWCSKMSYIGEPESAWHYAECPSFVVRRQQNIIEQKDAALRDVKFILRPWLDKASGRKGTVAFGEWDAAIERLDAALALTAPTRDGETR